MQNKKKYQQFHDEQDYPRGIPVGIPVQNPTINSPQHQPYFHQNNIGMNQNMGLFQPQAPQVIVQSQSSKIYHNSIQTRCQCCRQNVQTIVSHETGNNTIIWGGLICCFIGQCCCLPWLFNDCLDKVHYCPNCGQNILRKHAKCFDFIN